MGVQKYMSVSDIRAEVIRAALRQMEAEFWTKDVSERHDVRAAHAVLASHRNYHAFVGKFLARCPDVQKIPGDGARGARWKNKLSAVSRSALLDAAVENDAPRVVSVPATFVSLTRDDLGPQSSGDEAFAARMRLHQSWYRAKVLGVPCGTGPTRTSDAFYGNMLRAQDALRGLNFLSPHIHEVALARLGERRGKVEPFRLMHNMLSSQPMCFNLFGPLVRDRELARRVLLAIPGLDVADVVSVQLEYAPDPAHEYLNDGTAFDAFVDYRRGDGSRAFFGIETKLVEPFSQKYYDSSSHRRWMESQRSPFLPEAASRVAAIHHNQLWRDHLLAIALRDHARSPYAAGALMLVRHPGDASCTRIAEGYRSLLRPADQTFIDMPLDRLVGYFRDALNHPDEREWLSRFETRYLDLAQSALLKQA
jgi:hypothetical protein